MYKQAAMAIKSEVLPAWSFPAVLGPRSVGGWSALGLCTALFQPEVAYCLQTPHAWGSWSYAENGELNFTYFSCFINIYACLCVYVCTRVCVGIAQKAEVSCWHSFRTEGRTLTGSAGGRVLKRTLPLLMCKMLLLETIGTWSSLFRLLWRVTHGTRRHYSPSLLPKMVNRVFKGIIKFFSFFLFFLKLNLYLPHGVHMDDYQWQ